MKIQIDNEKVKRAQKIMRLVVKALNMMDFGKRANDCYPYASVETYKDCRENGFSISVYAGKKAPRQVIFSECKGSDQIVVYFEKVQLFRHEIPTDEMYKAARCFDTEEKAAKFCIRFLTK